MGVLRPAIRGDRYSFRLRFPDASYLVGAPGNVLAQVRRWARSSTVSATWTATVDGNDLVLSMAEVTVKPGGYVTDIQVGDRTFLPKTTWRVTQDVSR